MLKTERGTDLHEEIDGAIDDVLFQIRNSSMDVKIVGIGFANFCMNLIALDMNGQPVGKDATLSYACSSPEVANECELLKSYIGIEKEDALYQHTGAPLHSSYALPQLRQFYSNPTMSSLIDKIVVWQTLSSSCLSRWRGIPFSHVSFSEASWTGLLNFRTCEWDKDAVSLLPEQCQHHMPPLCDFSDEVMPSGGMRSQKIGESEMVSNPYWDRWPELRGTDDNGNPRCRLFFGLGDGACANIGSNCWDSQKFSVTIGTSAAVRVRIPMSIGTCKDYFYVPHGLFCYRIDRSHVLVGGALTDGGSVIEWARNLLNLEDEDDFAECLNEVESLLNQEYEKCLEGFPSPSAVSVAPFLSGERSVGFRDGASLCVSGLTRNSTRAHFLKACLEGVVLRLDAILRLLQKGVEIGKRKPRIVVSGAALEKNALWRQMLADCSGLQVQYDTFSREGTSRGVAMMVAVSLAMERDMSTDSRIYLINKSEGESIYSSPRLPITESYWAIATEDQETLIDAVSQIW
eukprot:CAMPEP_0178915198 /NCGR_PEP_ID=MMETSP0786-20121207/11885_1 /TAXON_ID=186022 /ORGANISM="Thalassionema frauenfeldii, Strain CCMP 1798" /LENGTH=516 /DNA_ID=CAMNT_0020588265 /DNA_START=397 /DNA_END=1947 /DNA_ORIENTATION=+